MQDPRTPATAALLVALGAVLAPHASGQVELPRARRTPPPSPARPAGGEGQSAPGAEQRDLVDFRTLQPAGTVTVERRNTEEPGVLGLAAEARGEGSRQDSRLQLPSGPRAPRSRLAPPAAAPRATDPPEGEAAPPTAPNAPGAANAGTPEELDALRPAVRLVYETVARASRPEERVVSDGARSLASFGPEGLAAARLALQADHAPLFALGVRALLAGGEAADADLVLAALSRKMPARAAGYAVDSLVELDPVRASPATLVALLRHPQVAARSAAERALGKRMRDGRANSELATALAPALDDATADVRGRAVDLLARTAAPEAIDHLFARIDDRSPTVARKACDALGRFESDEVDALLLAAAFEDPLPTRRQAHVWIAIADREDRTLRPILTLRHAQQLQRALDSAQPLIAGSAAVALAGIGFRSPDIAATAWLERDVPLRLVKVAAGFEFFPDFQTLLPTALRRLQQVSGVNFAGDGEAWTRWWLDGERTFRATRAVLPIDAEREGQLVARIRRGDADAFTLLGPDLIGTPDAGLGIEGEEVWLDASQARDFVALLREEGLFGFERLPGARGALGERGRSLELALGEARKGFRFADGLGAPWFDRVLEVAVTLREQNRWQRFPHPEEHGDRRGVYLAERDWFAAERSADERHARREGLLVRHLEALRPDGRDAGLRELAALGQHPGVLDQEDVPRLLAWLDEEIEFGPRARLLAALVRRAAGIDGVTPGGEEVAVGDIAGETVLIPTAAATAVELERVLHDRFGPYAADELGLLLIARGREAARAAARGERGLMRAIAATVLGRGTDDSDIALLRGLLEDPDPDVKIAAILSLGRARAVAARDDITLLAGYGDGAVRQAALRALGQLGGPGVLDVLVRALTGPDQRLKVPAAEGIATLRSPEALPILMSLLRAGRRSETFDAARTGLRALGAEAYDDLYAGMRAPSAELRRESALLLAEQLVADTVPVLIRVMTEDPEDSIAATELVVLTCVDHRAEADPSEAWYRWWDEVDRKDPLAWFRAACESRALAPPPAESFQNGGTREVREFLLALFASAPEPWLAERARRELGRLLGGDLGQPPAGRELRAAWFETLEERLREAPAGPTSPAAPKASALEPSGSEPEGPAAAGSGSTEPPR